MVIFYQTTHEAEKRRRDSVIDRLTNLEDRILVEMSRDNRTWLEYDHYYRRADYMERAQFCLKDIYSMLGVPYEDCGFRFLTYNDIEVVAKDNALHRQFTEKITEHYYTKLRPIREKLVAQKFSEQVREYGAVSSFTLNQWR